MKKFTLLLGVVLAFVANSYAQTSLTPATIDKHRSESTQRCATMERVQIELNADANARAIAQRGGGIFPLTANTPSSYRTNAIVTIPVVMHIVLPNPGIVTDADVDSQIKEFNDDFSGLNPDSTNIPAVWGPLRGHSQIRFTLARRTPTGAVTNGIERRASATGSNVNLATDPIKRTASGGLDAWDASAYLNVWIGADASGQGILGYAQFPGTGSALNDGVFLNYQSFGIGGCNNIPVYNKGRTGGHEVGHYFGLFHLWGDEGGCTGDDFRAMSAVGSTCVLPANLANAAGQGNTASDVGDTPNQGGATTNCPAGVATDACATAAPGKMYQNYMDYTADNCYSMFTNKQVERMEFILDNCRAGLKTSLGAVPPAGAIVRDATPSASVNPGGFEQVGCTITNFPSVLTCPGPVTPKVRITNNGLNNLTSVTVGMIINNGAPTTVNVSPNLLFGTSTVVSFPAINVTVGTYTIKYYTANANGAGADQVPTNDTLTTTLTVSAASPLPASQNFTNGPFPQTPWTLFNPNNNFTWIWVTAGNPGPSIAIDNYNNNNPGQIDEFRSTALSVGTTDSVIITFDVAHKNYPGSNDILSVWVSTNCGQTFTATSYSKSGATLATAGSSTAAYVAPAAGDWRRERLAIGGPLLASGQIIVAFRNTNAFGNNIFIDNINIDPRVARNIKADNILTPGANECSPTFTPRLIVRNEGIEAVTAFKVGYSLNGGPNVVTSFTQAIPVGGATTVSLPVATGVTGANSIRIFTADPLTISGTGDNVTGNDTLVKAFTVVSLINAPVFEGFEGTFPPPGWTILNPNNALTWVKRAPGRNSGFSAFIDNFNGVTGDIDEMRLPAMRVTGDSVIFSFDLAARYYSATLADTLSIELSSDCGNTFTSVYKKWGPALGALSTAGFTAPVAADWRRERVAIGGAALLNGSIVLKIKNTSRFGNNIFVDNVNIEEVFRRDIELTSINAPLDILCSSAATAPVVTVTNRGIDAITAFKVSHVLDNGAASTTNVTGVNLATGQSLNVTLNTISPAIGTHTLRVYTSDPVSVSGTGDSRRSNDTLSKTFFVSSIVALPLVESFEGTTFPSSGWAVVNPDASVTWTRTTTAARTGVASATINNFNYNATNTTDRLVTPVFTQTIPTDSVFLNFDVAYAAGRNYPGSTNLPLDTLEVAVTNDCGVTFTSIWKKWGEDLQTLGYPYQGQNNPNAAAFTPTLPEHWKNIRLYLNPSIGTGNFQVYFNAKSNGQNNLFIDNVNFNTRTLPARLKTQGYLIYPSPFTTSFQVHHFAPPTTLRGVSVHNAAGQLVFDKQYNGNATTEMTIDLGKLAAGVYLVKLNYLNKTVTERVVKQQ